jgi:hypothetical protein
MVGLLHLKQTVQAGAVARDKLDGSQSIATPSQIALPLSRRQLVGPVFLSAIALAADALSWVADAFDHSPD